MSQSNDQLESLELNPWRVLVIAAHPGDIELGVSAAVAKWTKGGAEVNYLIATRGELSLPGVEPEEAALVRTGEQFAAAAVVGVTEVEFLDLNDGTLEPSVRLRRTMVRDIRRFRPDVVVTLNHNENEVDGTRNDPDHRAIGIAALDAVGAAANQWAFRDLGEAHTVDTVVIAGSPAATHAIDVTGFEDVAAQSFAAHKEHLEALAGHPMADAAWVASALKADADRLTGATSVVIVQQVHYGQGRPCHSFIVAPYEDPDGHARVMALPEKSKSGRARDATEYQPDKPRRSKKAKAPVVEVATVPAMKVKVQLERNGRSIGIEIPDSVMSRLTGARPNVSVEINGSIFESAIGTTGGKRFIAINAERRKAAGIDVDDTFFVALADLDAPAPQSVEAAPEPEPEPAAQPKRGRRRRPSKGRSKK